MRPSCRCRSALSRWRHVHSAASEYPLLGWALAERIRSYELPSWGVRRTRNGRSWWRAGAPRVLIPINKQIARKLFQAPAGGKILYPSAIHPLDIRRISSALWCLHEICNTLRLKAKQKIDIFYPTLKAIKCNQSSKYCHMKHRLWEKKLVSPLAACNYQ